MCDANIFPVGFIVGLQLHYYSFHRDITGFLESSSSESHSVMSNSLQPHGIANPWNSPGQNTGVDSLYLLQGILTDEQTLYLKGKIGSSDRFYFLGLQNHCRR